MATDQRLFVTDEGTVVPALSVTQMREVDRVAVEKGTPSLLQMMENAGRNLAEAAVARLGKSWPETPLTVFTGSGNNGGGGLVAARHLVNHGGEVNVVLAEGGRANPVVEQQFAVLADTPARVGLVPLDAGLVIDALIGYGLTGAPHGSVAELIAAINESSTDVISLDVPSGLDADTGNTPGPAVVASETLTLALPKRGLTASAAGDVWLGDLGIPVGVYARVGVEVPPTLFEHGYRIHLNRI